MVISFSRLVDNSGKIQIILHAHQSFFMSQCLRNLKVWTVKHRQDFQWLITGVLIETCSRRKENHSVFLSGGVLVSSGAFIFS